MKLTVLGSGTSQLWKGRSSPGYFLQAGDQKMVLDLGQGSLRRLIQTGRNPVELTAVLISHHHLDHMADLMPLLFALNYDPVLSVKADIDLLASSKFEAVLADLAGIYGKWIEPRPSRLSKLFIEPGDEVMQGDVRIITAKAEHIDTSIAFRLEYGGRSLVYLGDSAHSPALVELARRADMLITHLGDRGNEAVPKHLNAKTAGMFAAEAGVKALLLSHLYADMDAVDAQNTAGREYSGPIRVAEDFMELDI